MHHDGRRVGIAVFSPTAEPAPPAVAELHFRQRGDAFFDHAVEQLAVEDRIAFEALPLLGTLAIVPDLLGVEVGAFVANLVQIEIQLQQHFLGHHRGQESIECLFRAAVRVVGQVRQRIHHRACQRRRVADLQAAFLRPPLLGYRQADLVAGLLRTHGCRPRLGLQHPVNVARDAHLHGIRLFIGQRLHPYGNQSLAHARAPASPLVFRHRPPPALAPGLGPAARVRRPVTRALR